MNFMSWIRMLNKQTIEDVNLKGKKVLVRVDFNVPLDDSLKITDDMRIISTLPTIQYLVNHEAKIILMSHLGRPKGKFVNKLSLEPVYERLKDLIDSPVKFAPDCIGPEVKAMVNTLNSGEILILENLRFHEGETKNDPEFVSQLAKLGDIYVNDAFGTAHRAHASTEGVAHYLHGVAGFLLKKEINYLENAIENPNRPFVAILGGRKVADKIPVIKKLMERVESIIFGGAMVFTFLKAQGKEIGSSVLDEPGLVTAQEIMELAKAQDKELVFPVDIIAADKFSEEAKTQIVTAEEGIPQGWLGVDIGPKTIEKYARIIKAAKSVLWNGPPGVFEIPKFAEGTKELARIIAETEGLTSIIGGGDTAAAVDKFGFRDKMTHISTGGGASLELLEGKILPGIAVLQDK